MSLFCTKMLCPCWMFYAKIQQVLPLWRLMTYNSNRTLVIAWIFCIKCYNYFTTIFNKCSHYRVFCRYNNNYSFKITSLFDSKYYVLLAYFTTISNKCKYYVVWWRYIINSSLEITQSFWIDCYKSLLRIKQYAKGANIMASDDVLSSTIP